MNAFMATGFDWRAIVLTIINLIITFVIWVPFVIAANKLEETELDSIFVKSGKIYKYKPYQM